MNLNQLPPPVIDDAHLGWKPRCGLCGQAMRPNENILALLGNEDSTCPAFCTSRSPFTDSPLRDGCRNPWEFDTMPRCGKMGCRTCDAEGVAIHADCYDVFMLNCEPERALDRIWVANSSTKEALVTLYRL